MSRLASIRFSDGELPEVMDVVRLAGILFAAGQETTTRLLSAGMRVLCEQPTVAALDAARTHAPEVMLIDLGLPRVDGYEVARRMRQEAGFQGILLVAVSDHCQPADRERAQDAGFDHHLLKPVEPEVLFELLRGWAQPRRRADG